MTMCTGPFIYAVCLAVEQYATHYTRVKNFEMGGVFLNRGRLMIIIMFVPVIALFIFIDKILILIGDPPEVAELTWKYVLILLPGQIFFALSEVKSKYLNGIGWPFMGVFFRFLSVVL